MFVFGIGFPGPSEDITDEKDDFTAYGDTDTQVTEVFLEAPDTSRIDPLQPPFSDPQTLHFWSAQFPSLTQTGTYTLNVTDGTTTKSASPHIN
jgi:hypothetical protein